VTFLIDADGILQVAARDVKTGNEQSVEVRPTYGLTEAEVERMLLSGEANAEADLAYRRLVDTRNQAEPLLRAAEGRLGEAYRLLPEADARGIEERVQDLRSAIAGTDCQAIQDASFALGQSTQRLADLLMKDVVSRAARERRG
jgi:molecular chaperone DnaK